MIFVFCALLLAVMLLAVRLFFRGPWRALRTGRYEGGGIVVTREREPLRFWFYTALFSFVSVMIVYSTVGGLLAFVGIATHSGN